jgi:two-component system alkaline phosphatase synthesis response regulator PhoP
MVSRLDLFREPSYTVGIVGLADRPAPEVLRLVEREGLAYQVVSDDDRAVDMANTADIHVMLLDLTEVSRPSAEAASLDSVGRQLPLIVLLAKEQMPIAEVRLDVDDVIICPWSPGELTFRVRRLVERSQQMPADAPGVIRGGDLVIDTHRYDVFVAGKPVLLTFKEYELLKLLASHPGRVFSREALLEQVWGYEYFGGTRTVDVHVRRLRSKIDDADHTFIDTVWNVGYRFRA